MADNKNVRTFWDVEASQPFSRPIVTQDDIDRIDWENITADELLARFPVGTSFEVAIHVLVSQIVRLTRRVNELESELSDRVLLDPSYDSKPNR